MAIEPTREIQKLVAFEGRGPGTDAERRAAGHLERRLQSLGREAEVEPTGIFPNYPVAHVIHALLAIVGSVVSVSTPALGAAIVLFATLSTFLDLGGSVYLVRRLTGRRASQNVMSREDSAKPGVLILMANYDAPRGGLLYNRRRRRPGPFEPFFWAMFAVLLCTIVRLLGLEGVGLTIVQFIPTVVLIAYVPLLADIALSDISGGEGDNAKGVATVLQLAERFGGKLEHFEVWVLFPGAGEALLGGMREWIKRHKRDLDPARTIFLNVDGDAAGWVGKAGYVVGMRFHPELIRLCQELGAKGTSSRWASDALMARQAGFPAITLASDYEFCAELVELMDTEIGPELS